MAIDWTKLQGASNTILTKAGDAKKRFAKLPETQQGAWAHIAGQLDKAHQEATNLHTAAQAATDEQAASKRLADCVKEVNAAITLIEAELAKLPKDDALAIKLDAVAVGLKATRTPQKTANEALGLATVPSAPAPGPSAAPVAAPSSAPAVAPSAPAPGASPAPAGTPPSGATPVTKPPVEKAVAAANEASTKADTVAGQAALIEKAGTLAHMKTAAGTVVTSAGQVKGLANEAKIQANEAVGKTTGTEKTAWETAAQAAEKARKDAETLETAAKAIDGTTTDKDAKTAAGAVVSAANTAKDSAAAAKRAVADAANAGGSAAAPAPGSVAAPSADKTVGKKEEPKQVPNSFGVSITAAYSRKFSLDTTVHSKIEVTMVPYPPPQQFLDWVRAEYNKMQQQQPNKKS
jgi:hypothetical protein